MKIFVMQTNHNARDFPFDQMSLPTHKFTNRVSDASETHNSGMRLIQCDSSQKDQMTFSEKYCSLYEIWKMKSSNDVGYSSYHKINLFIFLQYEYFVIFKFIL